MKYKFKKRLIWILIFALIAGPIFPATQMYFSVGISTNDFKTASNVTVSGTTATFTAAQINDSIGVGDRLVYNTTDTAYIVSKTSTSVWSVRSKTGGTPQARAGVTVNSIKRTFNSLNAAIDTNNSGASVLLGTEDLASADIQLNIACYADGDDNNKTLISSDWTVDVDNYIKVFTPTNTETECNKSQRHIGKPGGDGYRIDYNNTASLQASLTITPNHTVVEGIYFLLNGGSLPNQTAIKLAKTFCDSSTVNSNLIHYDNYGSNTEGAIDCNEARYNHITNNICISDGATRAKRGIYAKDVNTAKPFYYYIYNNTCIGFNYNFYLDKTDAATAEPVDLYNNIAQDGGTNDFYFNPSFNYNSDYNLSSDTTADDEGGANNVINTSLEFKDSLNNDYHLALTDIEAICSGIGPGADSNVPTDDIDGDVRSGMTTDIGADETEISGLIRLLFWWFNF